MPLGGAKDEWFIAFITHANESEVHKQVNRMRTQDVINSSVRRTYAL